MHSKTFKVLEVGITKDIFICDVNSQYHLERCASFNSDYDAPLIAVVDINLLAEEYRISVTN